MTTRAGMVALIGRPNVGKSTLMNKLIGEKVSITTPVAQTTRNQIRGIQTTDRGQIVYLDTPGIHRPKTALNRYMVLAATNALETVDVVLYLIDATRTDPVVMGDESGASRKHPGVGEDAMIFRHLKKADCPVFLVVNKVDRVKNKASLLPIIEKYTERLEFAQVIPISAETGDGTEALVSEIFQQLPEIPPMFPAEYSTDRAERFLVAELIREKLILHTRKELPHSVAVVIEEFDEEERGEREGHGLIRISAMIVVERSSQKGIVIGKRGAMLKQVGSEARADIEALLGCKVFLKLWVKVDENWSRNQMRMRELGYEEEY